MAAFLSLGAMHPAPAQAASEKTATQKAKSAAQKSAQKKKSTKSTAKKSTKKKTTTHARKKTGGTYNPRYASIVIDAETGAVLSESGADASVYPASLTKLMTLLLTFERLETGTISLNQRVYISNNAARQPPSKLGIPAGSSIELKNAIYALVTKSANDISVALAESVGGSEGHFVYMMNQKAKEIGMRNTRFANPHGLHNTSQVTTARDFALLSRYLMIHYPREYKYFSTRNFTYNGVTNRNHNRLMETYRGMDGLKTGYIIPSGFNLAASAVRDNRRIIGVVFGGKTAQSRNAEMARLLDAGFDKLNGRGEEPLIAQNTVQVPAKTYLQEGAQPSDARLAAMTGIANARTPAVSQVQPRKAGETSPVVRVTAATQPPTVRVPQSGAMGELAGQGDIDPAATRRFEAGMTAIAAIKGTLKPGDVSSPPADHLRTLPSAANDNNWAIQLGSYSSRVKSDEALNAAIAKLPADVRANAQPVIVPLKAGEGWVYRARLQGFSREQAGAACKYFNNCMAISPRAF